MTTVVVETEKPVADYGCWKNNIPYLDLVAKAIERLGHKVVRWERGPSLEPSNATHIFLWGSEHSRACMRRIRAAGMVCVHLDWGWLFDRFDNLQMDNQGNGGTASWVGEPLAYESKGPLPVPSVGDILVCLRYEGREPICTDPITTPFFPTNSAWLHHLRETCPFPLRARCHYAYTAARRGALAKEFEGRVVWDTSPSFREAANTARAVAVIDSTTGAQALELGLPVFCFGRQVFRHPGVCYCLGDDTDKTRRAFTDLERGQVDIDVGAVKAMVEKIRVKQWYLKDQELWPARLQEEFGL